MEDGVSAAIQRLQALSNCNSTQLNSLFENDVSNSTKLTFEATLFFHKISWSNSKAYLEIAQVYMIEKKAKLYPFENALVVCQMVDPTHIFYLVDFVSFLWVLG